MKTKICIDCEKTLALDLFPKRGGRICRKCRYLRYKETYRKYYNNRMSNDPKFKEKEREKHRKISKQRHKNGKSKKYNESTIRTWLSLKRGNMLTHAKRSSLKIETTLNELCEIWKSQNGKCALSGLGMVTQFYSLFAASPDRINQNKGYVKGNVQLVCSALNLAKNKHSNDDMLEFIKALRKTHSKVK